MVLVAVVLAWVVEVLLVSVVEFALVSLAEVSSDVVFAVVV